MQNLRDKLLGAGLISEAEATKAEAAVERKARAGGGKRRRGGRGSAVGMLERQEVVQTPERLAIMQVIEEHRVRGDTRGIEEFHFEVRGGRIRKMFITREVAHGLTSGRMGIVEWGEPDRHILVAREAIDKIRALDHEAVRFFAEDQPS